jgi:hypothetical protein
VRPADLLLAAVAGDGSGKPLARKIIDDRPAAVHDQCSDGVGQKLTDGLCPSAIVPVYGTPRTVAGDAITTDDNKCQLKPLRRGDYKVTFTDAQWAQLQATFPNGVCDFSKPGVSQQPTIPWLTYQDAKGNVIYGGRPLGAAPAEPDRARPRAARRSLVILRVAGGRRESAFGACPLGGPA